MDKLKIAVVGLGYVGISMSVLLSQHNTVYATDLIEEKVDKINKKISPIKDELIQKWFTEKELDLTALANQKEAVKDADFVIVSVPTNLDMNTNTFDMSSVTNVIQDITNYNPNATIVIKSTVPIGYTCKIRDITGNRNILFSPEFLRETKALYDNLYPNRIIVGTDMNDNKLTQTANIFAELLTKGAVKDNIPVLIMDFDEAEAVKLFANGYLAMRVAYFNELDSYAEKHGLNTQNIIKGVCLDDRIGDWYNNPSFGYGGICFPKDTKQLRTSFENDRIPNNIISSIVDANASRKDFIANQILKMIDYSEEKNYTIGIFRLIMKTGSDDFRFSSIQGVMKRLAAHNGINIIIYEPDCTDDKFYGYSVTKDLKLFKRICDVIVTNRADNSLFDVKEKVYTRDLFYRD